MKSNIWGIGGSWRQTRMKMVAVRAQASRLISSNASANPSSDAVSISEAIRTQGDKAHEFLRRYRTRLSESLVVEVLDLLRNPESGVKFFIWAGRQIGYSHTAPVYEALSKTLRPGDDRLLVEIKSDDAEVLGRLLNLMVRKHCRSGWWSEAVEELSRLKAHGLRPTAATYSALVHVFARAGRLGEAELLRREMSASGLRLDVAALGCLANALCRAGKWREALDLVPAPPDAVLFTKMVSGLCEASLFDDAMDFLDRMRSGSCFPNAVTYKVLLGACLRKRKLGRCKRVLCMMISEGCFPHPKLFESLVFAFCASGDFKFAYNLLRKMESSGSRPGFVVYNVLIGGVCGREESPSSDLLDLAEKAYGEMLESGVVLNKVNVVNFARCLCEVGRFERAHGVVSDMMKKGFVPDTSTYSKVIGFMCSSSELEKALFLFEEMKANGVVPGIYTYTILIDRFCKAGLTQQGRKLFDEMLRNGCSPNVVTYTALIHAYLKHGKVSDADKLFGTMLKDGCAPNIVTYTALIDGHFKARRPKKAVQIYERMRGNGVESPDTDIYFKTDGSESNQLDVFTYGAVVDGLCKAHRVEEANDLLDAMMEKGCEPNSIVYDALIDGFCKAGKVDEAEKVFSKMSDSGYSPTMFTYGSLIDGLFKCKRLDLVMKVLSKMEENSCQPNVVIYTQMVDGLCKVGKLAEAYKLMLKMKEKNCNPNVVTYTAMMDGFGRAGQVERSLGLLREMCSKGCAPNFVTYRVLITHCCAAGLLDEARELLCEMKQTYWPKHMGSYRKVIESYSRDFLASLGILNEISNYESVPMLSMYSILIEKFLKAERLEVALELYDEISSSIRLSKNMYTLLIESLSNGGKLGKGFELFADMLSRGRVPELTTLVHLIKGLVQVDRWNDAFRLSQSICHMGTLWIQEEDTYDGK